MTALSLDLEDESDAALSAVCATCGRNKTELVTDVVRRFLRSEQLKNALADPALGELYAGLAVEDIQLANQGIDDYRKMLDQADRG